MTEKKLTMEHIAEKISVAFGEDLKCIFNDDNAPRLIMRIRIMNSSNNPFNQEVDDEDEAALTRLDDNMFLRYIESDMLSDMTLQGIESISKVYMHLPQTTNKKRIYITETGEFKSVAEWMLETDGTALMRVLSEQNVDQKRTFSNDICEMFTVLGIEAVRKSIEKEMNNVLQFYGLYVNYRHLALLCDIMTAKGHLMAITRHGINRQQTGPLMRCSFEETVDVLLDAAAHGERDPMKGVSENIIIGQMPRIGTGCFDMILDTAKCKFAMDIDGANKNSIFYGTMFTPTVFSGSVRNSVIEFSPSSAGAMTPQSMRSACFSPLSTMNSPMMTPEYNSPYSSPSASSMTSYDGQNYYSLCSPMYSCASPLNSNEHDLLSTLIQSPKYSPTSLGYSPTSQRYLQSPGSDSDSSNFFSPTSPTGSIVTTNYSPTSPDYSPPNNTYSPTSPLYSPPNTQKTYSPTSPAHSSSIYSPSSPLQTPESCTNKSSISCGRKANKPKIRLTPYFNADKSSTPNGNYSPSSRIYSPTNYTVQTPRYSPSTPSYNPSSPSYSSVSPSYAAISPQYSPLSPSYSHATYSPMSSSSPRYALNSASNYSCSSPRYSSSTSYSPTSSSYSTTCANYSPSSPNDSPLSPSYNPSSPIYSPSSPNYSPNYNPSSPTSPIYSPTNSPKGVVSPLYSSSPPSPSYSSSDSPMSPISPLSSPMSSPRYSPNLY